MTREELAANVDKLHSGGQVMKPATAIVIEAEATEQQPVERAKAAENNAFWIGSVCQQMDAAIRERPDRCGLRQTDRQVRNQSQPGVASLKIIGDVRESQRCVGLFTLPAAVA